MLKFAQNFTTIPSNYKLGDSDLEDLNDRLDDEGEGAYGILIRCDVVISASDQSFQEALMTPSKWPVAGLTKRANFVVEILFADNTLLEKIILNDVPQLILPLILKAVC